MPRRFSTQQEQAPPGFIPDEDNATPPGFVPDAPPPGFQADAAPPQSDSGAWAGIKRAVGGAIGLPGAAYHAATDELTPEELKSPFRAAPGGILAKRLLIDPYTAPQGPLDVAKQKAAKGEYAAAGIHGVLGAIPFIGPYAENLSQRATGTGAFEGKPTDYAGAATEALTAGVMGEAAAKVPKVLEHTPLAKRLEYRAARGRPTLKPQQAPVQALREATKIGADAADDLTLAKGMNELKAAETRMGKPAATAEHWVGEGGASENAITDLNNQINNWIDPQKDVAVKGSAQKMMQAEIDAIPRTQQVEGGPSYADQVASIKQKWAGRQDLTRGELNEYRKGANQELRTYYQARPDVALSKEEQFHTASLKAKRDTAAGLMYDEMDGAPNVKELNARIGAVTDVESGVHKLRRQASITSSKPSRTRFGLKAAPGEDINKNLSDVMRTWSDKNEPVQGPQIAYPAHMKVEMAEKTERANKARHQKAWDAGAPVKEKGQLELPGTQTPGAEKSTFEAGKPGEQGTLPIGAGPQGQDIEQGTLLKTSPQNAPRANQPPVISPTLSTMTMPQMPGQLPMGEPMPRGGNVYESEFVETPTFTDQGPTAPPQDPFNLNRNRRVSGDIADEGGQRALNPAPEQKQLQAPTTPASTTPGSTIEMGPGSEGAPIQADPRLPEAYQKAPVDPRGPAAPGGQMGPGYQEPGEQTVTATKAQPETVDAAKRRIAANTERLAKILQREHPGLDEYYAKSMARDIIEGNQRGPVPEGSDRADQALLGEFLPESGVKMEPNPEVNASVEQTMAHGGQPTAQQGFLSFRKDFMAKHPKVDAKIIRPVYEVNVKNTPIKDVLRGLDPKVAEEAKKYFVKRTLGGTSTSLGSGGGETVLPL